MMRKKIQRMYRMQHGLHFANPAAVRWWRSFRRQMIRARQKHPNGAYIQRGRVYWFFMPTGPRDG